MNDKLYIKKFIRDDGETLAFDGEQIYLAKNNTLLVRPDPSTTAVNFTEADGGEMIRQQNTTYDQPVNGLIIPKSTDYWTLSTQLSLFFKVNHTYKIIYVKKDGTMFAVSNAWISSGLQIVPVPNEEYSEWSVTLTIGNVNWTEYAEDSQGKEIYSNTITLPLISAATGGEEWEYEEQEEVSGEGSEITFNDTVDGAKITDLTLKGDTFQQTYSGKNLLPATLFSSSIDGLVVTNDGKTINISGTANRAYPGITNGTIALPATIPNGTVITLSMTKALPSGTRLYMRVYPESGSSYKDVSIANDETSVTVTLDRNFARTQFLLGTTLGTQFDITNLGIQVEANSSATSFEPYTGGIPAPNPDYPQDIDVVTGAQTVKVTGKNLWDMTNITGGSNVTITKSGNEYELYWTGGFNAALSTASGLDSSKNYILSFKHKGEAITLRKVGTSSALVQTNQDQDYTTYTYSFDSESSLSLEFIRRSSTSNVSAFVKDFQIEEGSTATTYQPYQSQSYTVDLGSTELCKIGDYQDYIYKSGDDWYVHKDCGKSTLGSLSWTAVTTNQTNIYRMSSNDLSGSFVPPTATSVAVSGISTHFITVPANSSGTYGAHEGISATITGVTIHAYHPDYNTSTSETSFKTWLTNNNVTFYYALATPTDTKITDNTLIGELEALYAAEGYNDKTIITVSATGTNLPAILAVTLQNPPVTGEVWDTVGTVWELGSGGTQTINIDSTTTIYPVWVVEGPCVNPTLQNNTTDTIAQYDGTVAAGQTLTVDFAEGTAHLDSALVTRYVNGLVSLRPGENTIGFNSDGGDTETSTISWNNVIN